MLFAALLHLVKIDRIVTFVADPPQCNSTNRQNPPNQSKIAVTFKLILLDIECPKSALEECLVQVIFL